MTTIEFLREPFPYFREFDHPLNQKWRNKKLNNKKSPNPKLGSHWTQNRCFSPPNLNVPLRPGPVVGDVIKIRHDLSRPSKSLPSFKKIEPQNLLNGLRENKNRQISNLEQ